MMEGLSNTPFSSLEGIVSDRTLKAVKDMGLDMMTEIQAKAIPQLLNYTDSVVCAKTGSGKTLAFLIPAIELMYALKWKIWNWTGVIILSPTRELAMQTYDVLKKLLKYHSFSHGIVMGGASRKEETDMLNNSVNILVATPGRLLDHLQNTPDFIHKNVNCLIIDEADRILDIGFEDEMRAILHNIRKARLTYLFSATFTDKTNDLIEFAIHKKRIYIGLEEEGSATVEGLKQCYIVCPSEKRFLALHAFLDYFQHKKVMVFFNSCNSVKFHYDIFNFFNFHSVGCIHGKMKQNERNRALRKFCREPRGVLLCTNVAARGLDIPLVDWIVQYDPPDDVKDYIHRVGRTARGINGDGQALLFIREEERHFIKLLKNSRIPIKSATYNWSMVPGEGGQKTLEEAVLGNYYYKQVARDAFISYIRAYKSHHLKNIFDESTLDHNAIAKSFGFPRPPYNFLRNK